MSKSTGLNHFQRLPQGRFFLEVAANQCAEIPTRSCQEESEEKRDGLGKMNIFGKHDAILLQLTVVSNPASRTAG